MTTSSNENQLQPDGKSRRLRERMSLALPLRVRCRETLEHEWAEMSKLVDVTPFGARFRLSHTTEIGRLLQLSLPMPRALRCFDHAEEQYRVWSLVRFMQAIEDAAEVSNREAATRFEIGVAFIGKHPPASFLDDPTTRYQVLAQGASGLWQLKEITHVNRARYVPADEPRPETRFNLPLEVSIEARDANGKIEVCEDTVTENISRRGAAVFTSLNLERGRFVRLTSRTQNISVMAVVRANRIGANGIPRLHLEFIDRQFPLDIAE